MTDSQDEKPMDAQAVLDKIMGQVFGYKNTLTLEQFRQKYAFDIRLPIQVTDSTTGQPTWTQSANPVRYISVENAWAKQDWDTKPAIPINSVEDILTAWNDINLTATERYMDSINISESDNIYGSENVYRSQDIRTSKNILFSDGFENGEFIAAGQRSNSASYCIRIEDSNNCSGSFSVVWSKKVVNSFFIQDCSDIYESMFCSHVSNKKFCIANMQYEEAEYRRIKDMVVRWILSA